MDYVLVNGEWINLINSDFVIFGRNDVESYFEKYYDRNMDKMMEYFPSYVESTAFSEGRMAVKGANNKWGFLDKDGECTCACNYDDVEDYYHGVAIVKLDDMYGVIDQYGNFIIPCVYADISYHGSYCEYLMLKTMDGHRRIERISELIGEFDYQNVMDSEIEFEDEMWLVHDNMVVKHEDDVLKLYQVDTKKKIVFNSEMFNMIKEKMEEESENMDGIKVFDLKDMCVYEVSDIVYFDTENIYKALRKIRGIY